MPPRQRLPSPSISSLGYNATTERPKLRSSCHACSSSKLKCSQEKPTCSRCAKRGLTCEYFVAKRGGRKPNNRSTITSAGRDTDVSNLTMDANNNMDMFALSASNPTTEPAYSLEHMHLPPRANVTGPSDMLQDFFGLMEQTPPPSDIESDFDDFPASSMSFDSSNVLGLANLFPTAFDDSSSGTGTFFDTSSATDDAMSGLCALPTPSFTPESLASPAGELNSTHQQESRITEAPCFCLIEALGLMKQVVSPPSNACKTSTSQSSDNIIPTPTIQAVIAQNEATVEAVSRMLDCSCAHDGYLLAIMSLIIFKVLGRYATAACRPPSSQTDGSQAPNISPQLSTASEQEHRDRPTIVGNYRLHGEDWERMAGQLVLSELHRVRQLVNQLSSKLKVQAAKPERGDTEPSESMDLDSEMTPALSAAMFDQLDNDLRKRLKTLSWKILEQLRRL